MNPRQLNINQYTYRLPDERIAKFPLAKRDESKLLVYKEGKIAESVFKHIAEALPVNSLIVFNNTRVIHARILFNRPTGAKIEVFCIEPAEQADYQQTFAGKGPCVWKCLVGNARRWKETRLTKTIQTPSGNITLEATQKGRTGELFAVEFSWNTGHSFAEVLHYAGVLPLPPYLNRDSEVTDEERYQTIYATHQGSVAAPTAGLHFTDEVLESLTPKNIQTTEVTLHVGAGTFKPVKTETLSEHEMHEETLYITLATLKQVHACLVGKQPLVAVGTTSTRTLESLYWHGVLLLNGQSSSTIHIAQWTPYETEHAGITAEASVKAIIDHLEAKGETVLTGATRIIIAPGYAFKMVDILVTNFHQPENTLILLIAAFVGESWRKIYDYALQHDFRFLSYGDSSVLFRDH